jgi:hypothetical protein
MGTTRKEPVMCEFCHSEALPDVELAGHPVCGVHWREIALELQTNCGRRITPTRAERAARQDRFKHLMEAERDWQSRQKWVGR